MASAGDLIAMSKTFDSLIRPVFDEAIATLSLPPDSGRFDPGCGAGLQAMMSAEAVGPNRHVTGLDLSPESIVGAEELARDGGLSGCLSFRQGGVTALLRFSRSTNARCALHERSHP